MEIDNLSKVGMKSKENRMELISVGLLVCKIFKMGDLVPSLCVAEIDPNNPIKGAVNDVQ